MLYNTTDLRANKYVKYGIVNEKTARDKYSEETSNEVQESGIFVDMKHPYLGASPDGLVGEDGLIEIKCLPSIAPMTFKEAIEAKKHICLELVEEELRLKEKHEFYYQIQGQLQIAQREWCDLVVFTENDFLIHRVFRNDALWHSEILPKLKHFFLDCMLPELVDPRLPRGLKMRDSKRILAAQEKAKEKGAQKRMKI